MRKIAALLLLVAGLTGCQKDASKEQAPEQQALTVLFAPGSGFSGAGYDDTILSAVMESAATSRQFTFHLNRPQTAAQAATLAQQWQAAAGENDALLLCGYRYEDLARNLAPGKGRVLLLDSNQTLENGIATLQLKRYGGAYLAGALSYPFNMLLIKALNGDRMLDAVASGIEDGYLAAGGAECVQLVLSDTYAGMNMPDQLFSALYEGFATRQFGEKEAFSPENTCLVPVCGASRAGAYSFSRNMFTVALGIGEDCSHYSEMLPYSLIYDLGSIVKEYIGLWLKGERWPAHADFGLATGHVRILYNEHFFEEKTGMVYNYKLLLDDYKKLEAQYSETALEKEGTHAY